MNPEREESTEADMVLDSASQWVVKRDRGFTAAESYQFEEWLAASPRHRAAFQRLEGSWSRSRDIGELARRFPVSSAESRGSRSWASAASVAAAAAIVLAVVVWRSSLSEGLKPAQSSLAASGAYSVKQLSDGSVARVRGGSEVVDSYSSTERRIKLQSGEAFFAVTSDPTRPFLVEAGNVTVRAVGTAFGVNLAGGQVDIVVTEGRVKVTAHAGEGADSALVSAGQQASVDRDAQQRAQTVRVKTLSAEEISRALGWSEPLMDLAESTLGDLAAAFERRTGRRIEIVDPELRNARIGGQFPADDVDGFVRVLEKMYELTAERSSDGSIRLRKRP